jgi:glycosyltransferase involved in cell wall biosynthesis
VNILIISNCPLDKNQGSGYVICGFAEGLRQRGHQVKTFGPEEVILLPGLKAGRRLRLFLGYTLKAIIEGWNRSCSYDIIELWGGPGWCACVVLTRWRRARYRVISRSNGLEPHHRQVCRQQQDGLSLRALLGKVESYTDGLGFRHADLLTLVSRFDEGFALQQRYQHSGRVVKIDNPLPDEWLHQEVQKEVKNCVFGYVGSWSDNKGAKQLIRIINRVKSMGSRAKWIFAGVGSKGRHELLEKTALTPDEIYEHVDREELKQLYRKMTTLLCLSSYESFGMVCSEAMACGCILLSTDVGFASGLKDGEEYIRIDRNNTDAIANKLLKIESDGSRYRELSLRGYERVQNLKWTAALDTLERHYRTLLETEVESVK